MSQKVSPILFNNTIYNNSKWYNKINNKFALNEDLQIKEIISILFKNNVNTQYLFIDKIVIYKYYSKIKIYIYFFCNFNYLKKNLILRKKNYLNIIYIYYKYLEILNIKKIEIIKILSNLKYKYLNIYIYYKNINYKYNSFITMNSIVNKKKILKMPIYKYNLYHLTLNNSILHTKNLKIYKRTLNSKNLKKKYQMFNHKHFFKLNRYYSTFKYFKTIRFILYNICYNKSFLTKVSASNLINIIYYELDKLDNASKSYNFLFYNIFNLIRTQLLIYLKDNNCQIKGIRIQVKGRYFLTKRKRIFIFNLGNLNVNKIDDNKDYYCLHLIKSTGTSSIKIWLNYKN